MSKSASDPLRKTLSALGLIHIAKRWRERQLRHQRQKKLKPFQDKEDWKLQYRGVNVAYSTIDPYAKSWYYPRYGDGSIHEPITTDVFIDYVKPGGTVLDIGAHIGYFSCLAANLAREGSVHIFEIDPKCISLIEQSVALNGLQNTRINNTAVSDQSGTERIPAFLDPNPGLGITAEAKRFLDIPAIQVDEYVKRENITPDFIKIDVEGAEWKVLQGMSEVLALPNLVLLVEVHEDKLRDNFNTDYRLILQLLHQKGFTIRNIEAHRESNSAAEVIGPDSPLSGNTMLLCTRENS